MLEKVIIKNIQDFVQLIREQPPLEENEEYVSYDVESLFTNVLIHGTINIDEIYTHNKLLHICSKMIFKRLLLMIACIFQSQFYKQTDGCIIGGPL